MIDEKKLIEDIQKYHDGLKPKYISKLVDAEIADIIEIINEQPKVDVPDINVGEWIPVSERLPDKNGSYLVSFKEAITNSDGLCVKYWSGEEQRWRPCNYAPSVCWRAWMPLPEPYKEGAET